MKTSRLQVAFLFFFRLSLLGISFPALADESLWLPKGSSLSSTGSIPELLIAGTKLEEDILLGKLLFNSPSLLGEKAVRIGLSCNSCHPNGHRNDLFFIPELSSQPGTVDLTNAFWHAGGEDKIYNPLPIPSLRDVRNTAPYGHNNTVPSLQVFTKNVIVNEFGGPPPNSDRLKALLQYMNALAKSENAQRPLRPSPSLPTLLRLLQNPVLIEDHSELDVRIGLIKEELARQFKRSNEETLISLAKSLSELKSKAKKDKKSALHFLSEISDRYRKK